MPHAPATLAFITPVPPTSSAAAATLTSSISSVSLSRICGE